MAVKLPQGVEVSLKPEMIAVKGSMGSLELVQNSLVTVVQVNGQLFDLYTAVGFGIAAYFWRRHDWPRAPFVIAFIVALWRLPRFEASQDAKRFKPIRRPRIRVLVWVVVRSVI